MADTNFDLSLLDAGPAPEIEPTVVDVSEPVPSPALVVEPVTTQEPAAKEAAPPQVQDDTFDYSAPLTAREKILMERLEQMTGERLAVDSKPVAPEVVPLTPSGKNFLEGYTDLDEVFSSAENFNKLLLAVHNNALEESSKLTAERILSNLPQIMSQYVTQHISMTKLVDDFYATNADLAPVKRTVTAVANEIAAEHPEYTTQQVFDETAIKTRQILRLQQAPTGQPAKPAFVPPKGSRSRVQAPVLTEIERGVMDLIT